MCSVLSEIGKRRGYVACETWDSVCTFQGLSLFKGLDIGFVPNLLR